MTWNFDDPLKTPMARVRGHGSAKSGVHHWWVQRMTALLMIPLLIWFFASILHLAVGRTDSIGNWFSNPYHALLSVPLFGAMFYHAKLGMQVVLEDYVHCHWMKTAMLILNSFIFLLATLVSVLAVVKIHFSSISRIV